MYVKTLKTDKEANAFVDTVVMGEGGQIQITADGDFAVFYEVEKDQYEAKFLADMIERLGRNLYNETILLVSREQDHAAAKEKGTSYPEFDESLKKLKETRANIVTFEAKADGLLAAKAAGLLEWKAKNT